MGQIINYQCPCGYEKELKPGAGLHAINLKMIRRVFPEEAELIAENRDSVEFYELSNALAECSVCKELCTVPYLKYVINGTSKAVSKVCDDCGGKPIIHEDHKNVPCPKCGETITARVTGYWD